MDDGTNSQTWKETTTPISNNIKVFFCVKTSTYMVQLDTVHGSLQLLAPDSHDALQLILECTPLND